VSASYRTFEEASRRIYRIENHYELKFGCSPGDRIVERMAREET
jgi:hypothetical protein